MGLSNFPSAGDGMLPVLVMNTVISVTLVKNLFKSVHKFMAAALYWNWVFFFFSSSSFVSEAEEQRGEVEQEEYPSSSLPAGPSISSGPPKSQKRVVSVVHFKSLTSNDGFGLEECSVCLCRFEEEEEVSELSCKHFFHRHCLDNWFHNQHSTCPLCRSIT